MITKCWRHEGVRLEAMRHIDLEAFAEQLQKLK